MPNPNSGYHKRQGLILFHGHAGVFAVHAGGFVAAFKSVYVSEEISDLLSRA
jgi:hypothetical protein